MFTTSYSTKHIAYFGLLAVQLILLLGYIFLWNAGRSHIGRHVVDKIPENDATGGLQRRDARDSTMLDDWDPNFKTVSATPAIGRKRRLPQAIIIGARKCGTGALNLMLKMHPQIAATGEVHYFDKHYKRGLKWYKRRMPLSYPDQITIEKSPQYFITPKAPKRVYKMNKDVKLILIVRDPMVRMISDYADAAEKHRFQWYPTFEEKAVTKNGEVNETYAALTISIYDKHIKRWLEYFPRRQIHIVDGDRLIRNPYPEVKRTGRFLGLRSYFSPENFIFNKTKGFYCVKNELVNTCLGNGKGREHPQVSPDVLQKLRDYFRSFNQDFFHTIGRTFDWA